ncbi:MAG TPA: GDSL-type esterase/lipase family protein [Candidatus Acidoferrales bacterium]|nr:GDSL-type esterase/lipase family protein [Candidatus Acidoferrales bacterium]
MLPLQFRVIVIVLFWGSGILFSRAAVVVACIGDSITAGVGVTTPALESYPAKLQKLLGTNYNVLNYGVSGTTLLISGDMSYWNTGAFTASHNAPLPDIVIILLGTNDSKPQNWQYGNNFYSDYRRLISTYTNLTSIPRVLICTPPPVFGSNSYNINAGIIATNISPLVRQLGTNLNHQVIDLQTLLAGHGEWFPDYVHPNSQGTSVMAAIDYTALSGDTMYGAIPNPTVSESGNATVALSWPGGGAGWVVQTIPALGGTNLWTVVSNVITNDGTAATVTIPVPGPSAFFRLWNPSIQGL